MGLTQGCHPGNSSLENQHSRCDVIFAGTGQPNLLLRCELLGSHTHVSSPWGLHVRLLWENGLKCFALFQ